MDLKKTDNDIILYEKLRGTLYEKNSIQKILSCKYLDTLYQNNLNLNSLIIENGIKNNLIKNNSRIGLITINDSGINFLNNLITEINYDVLKEFDFFDKEAIKNFDNIFLLIESGKTNLKLINKISRC